MEHSEQLTRFPRNPFSPQVSIILSSNSIMFHLLNLDFTFLYS